MTTKNKQQGSKKSGFNWGKGLAIAIVLFISSTLGVVAFLMSLDYQIVTQDYYEKAEQYQEHIDRVEHAEALREPVEIQLINDSKEIRVRFPESLRASNPQGTIQLYRPSNSDMDRKLTLNLDNTGTQRISAAELAPGKWSVKINWSVDNKSYFKSENLFL